MEVASPAVRHPVYPAQNSSSWLARGRWAGEGARRLLTALPASSHQPCPKTVPTAHLALTPTVGRTRGSFIPTMPGCCHPGAKHPPAWGGMRMLPRQAGLC